MSTAYYSIITKLIRITVAGNALGELKWKIIFLTSLICCDCWKKILKQNSLEHFLVIHAIIDGQDIIYFPY